MLNLVIYALPALGWGLMSIISKKVGGKPVEQLFGTTIAALVFAVLIHLVSDIQYNTTIIVSAFFSGFFWTFGQLFQFIALKQNEVSKVMPISNGTQLLFTTLASGLILSEWGSPVEVFVSLIALFVAMLAINLFTKTSRDDADKQSKPVAVQTYIYLICSSLCLTLYVTITNYFKMSGSGIFLPQACGMFVVALLIYLLNKEAKDRTKVFSNVFTGISWAIANVAIFYTSMDLGVGLSYTISQLCVFVSIIGGVIFLGERKNKSETISVILGAILFFGAIIVLSQFK